MLHTQVKKRTEIAAACTVPIAKQITLTEVRDGRGYQNNSTRVMRVAQNQTHINPLIIPPVRKRLQVPRSQFSSATPRKQQEKFPKSQFTPAAPTLLKNVEAFIYPSALSRRE